jgi:hypothetical protein
MELVNHNVNQKKASQEQFTETRRIRKSMLGEDPTHIELEFQKARTESSEKVIFEVIMAEIFQN